jgi:hypothetical protein
VTTPTLPGLEPDPTTTTAPQTAVPVPGPGIPRPVPRPSSRLARAKMPRAKDVVHDLAVEVGVCVRPLPLRRINTSTGETEVIDVPCGSTLEAVCPTCAKKARILRAHQCREGWHLQVEPDLTPDPSTSRQRDLVAERAEVSTELDTAETFRDDELTASLTSLGEEIDADIADAGVRGLVDPPRKPARRVRSTRRRQDAPDLPVKPSNGSTLGRIYTDPGTGKTFRPSLFLTVTLPSYGKIRTGEGTPTDPGTYDYRSAARDALHFGKLLDRLVQNLRRVAGYDLQYFAVIEPQQRLAPHAHFAIRGTLPRALVKQVVAATYHQVWWPPTHTVIYSGARVPVWSPTADNGNGGYIDPDTKTELPTWDEALDALDQDDEPAHVARFGTQVDVQGLLAGSPKAEKAIGYMVKYLVKSLGDTLDPTPTTDSHENRVSAETDRDHNDSAARITAHRDRLVEALRYEPCSPTCPNWLRYGIQPKNARDGQRPGCCRSKAHKPSHLGYAGRRVLVSRKWTGKTLTDHRADRRTHVLTTLGISATDPDPTGEQTNHIGWEMAKPTDPDVPPLSRRLLRTITHHIHQRTQYQTARDAAASQEPSATSDHEPTVAA